MKEEFEDYPVGTEFLCIESFSPFLTKGGIYHTFQDCTGEIGIFDDGCKANEYEISWYNMKYFILNSPAMRIMYGEKRHGV